MPRFPFPIQQKYQRWGHRPDFPLDEFHKGLDFSGGTSATVGSPVAAAAAGIVVRKRYYDPINYYVEIDHGRDAAGTRWWTRYHMLGGFVGPGEGQPVAEGEAIGTVGPMHPPYSTGVHHHFEVHTDDTSLHTPNYLTTVDPEIYINRLPSNGTQTPQPGDDMYDATARAELYDQIANDARPIRLYTVGSGIHAMGPGGKSEIISNRAYVDLLIAMRLAGPATPLWNDAQFQWAKSISGRLNPDPQVNAAFASVLSLKPEEAEELARGIDNTTSVPVLSRAQVAELVDAATSGDDAKVEELSFVTVLD